MRIVSVTLLIFTLLATFSAWADDSNPLGLPTITAEQECGRTQATASLILGLSTMYDPPLDKIDCSKPKEAMAIMSAAIEAAQAKNNGDNSKVEAQKSSTKYKPYCTLNIFEPRNGGILFTPLINSDTSSCLQSCKYAASTQCDGSTTGIVYQCDFVDENSRPKTTVVSNGKIKFPCPPPPAEEKTLCRYNGTAQKRFQADQGGEAECANYVYENMKFGHSDYMENCLNKDDLRPFSERDYVIHISVDLGGIKFKPPNNYEFIKKCSDIKPSSKEPLIPAAFRDNTVH